MDKKPLKQNLPKANKSTAKPIELKIGNTVYRPFRIPYSQMAILYQLASDMGITLDDALAFILSTYVKKTADC